MNDPEGLKYVKVPLILTGIAILIFAILSIYSFYWLYKYQSFCESQNGNYNGIDNCIIIKDNQAVRYGITKVDDKFYLYKWSSEK